MKKPYRVVKYFICDLIDEYCICNDVVYSYSESMQKPECEKCDIFIEAVMKKSGLKKEGK